MKQQEISMNFVKNNYKIPVSLTIKFVRKICYLNSRINKDEWVGVLFYKEVGSIDDNSLQIELIDVYPVAKAHGMSFYSLTPDGTGLYLFDNYSMEEIPEIKYGMIHSHCSINHLAFSGTDNYELKSNIDNYTNFLSVITNNYLDFIAKYCTKGTSTVNTKTSFTLKGRENPILVNKDTTENIILYSECEFEFTDDINSDFISRVDGIIKEAQVQREELTKKPINNPTPSLFNDIKQYRTGFDEEDLTSFILNQLEIDEEMSFVQLLSMGVIYESSIFGPEVAKLFFDEDYTEEISDVLEVYEYSRFCTEMKKDYFRYVNSNEYQNQL